MRKTFTLAALAAALAAFAVPAAASAASFDAQRGAVYTLTNSAAGNGVAVFARGGDGSLTLTATYATGGAGTGTNLGSQGAVALSENGRRLFAVNAGSNSISEFAVGNDGLRLLATFDSNGPRPISLTVRKNLLYVLDAGGAGTITGFKVDGNGRVEALDGSTQALLGANPAQVAFSPDGSVLVVTEKGTSTLDTFVVGDDGRAQPGVSSPSAGATPFGFAFDAAGRAFVSEAAGSASSYTVDATGAHVITGAAATGQAAPCWLVVTPDGRYAYTANAGSATISGFSIAANGSLTLLGTGASAALGAGAHPLDESVSADGRTLYVLVDGRHTIAGYRIGADGSLSALGETGSLPAGAVGLVSS
jgi:6-phosphogluconolactonase (cycloisomerase 2 family)